MIGFHAALGIDLLWVATWGAGLFLAFRLLRRAVEVIPLGQDARERLVHVLPLLGVVLSLLFSLYAAESLFARFPDFQPIARMLVLAAFFIGARAIVRDFFAGVFIRSEDSCNVGDHVRIGSIKGRVTHFGPRGIQLETAEGDTALVPYAQAAASEITRTQSADRGASYTFSLKVGTENFSELKAKIERATLLHHFTSVGRSPEIVHQEGMVEVTLFVLSQEHAPSIKAAVFEAIGLTRSREETS